MQTTSPDGVLYKIGDLRISGPVNEVNEFLVWLKYQETCFIHGYDDIPSVRSIRSVEISIDCRISFDEIIAWAAKEDIKYGLATPSPPGTGNDESPEIEF